MKFLFSLLIILAIGQPLNAAPDSSLETFVIAKKKWTWSTEFELTQRGHMVGKIKKKTFMRPSTHYQLYDGKGQYQAEGVCVSLLGMFFAWATDIEVYDRNGQSMGYIDGEVASFQTARFSVYDHGRLIAIAFLDANCTSYSIVDAENQDVLVARLSRNFKWDTTDDWTVEVYDTSAISPEIVRIFAAFAVDSQDYFKKDK